MMWLQRLSPGCCHADGSYMQHIATETGANITLRGRGSGIQESDALHIYISSAIPKSFSEAAKLAQNLIDTVKSEHDKQVRPIAHTFNLVSHTHNPKGQCSLHVETQKALK